MTSVAQGALASVCVFLFGWIAAAAEPVANFFNGRDLAGWSDDAADMKYWSVVEGSIVGQSTENVPHNTFLWSDTPVGDFYLSCEVRLTPNNGNAGIQFRSQRGADGHAKGYQADVGEGWWGKLYHEHGRGLLDKNEVGAQAVKPGEWNRYEILTYGDSIWTAINGKLCTALRDPKGEREGRIALQIHSGPPIKVEYRGLKLIKNPKLELGGLGEAQLKEALRP
ncbi:MAG: DUF1080 domain-containing protein [Planctomycetes bacterium]|nr:DUF1080 domain-containing protein [Planctomycetota bacterium]